MKMKVRLRKRVLAPMIALVLVLSLFMIADTTVEEPVPEVVAEIATIPPEPEPVVVKEPELEWREGAFDKPFLNLMREQGLASEQVFPLIDTLTDVYDFRKARPDHRWRLGLLDGKPDRFTLLISPVKIYDVFDLDGQIRLEQRQIETFSVPTVVRGTLRGSLLQSLADREGGHLLALKLAEVFRYDIDFYQDPREGDTFEVLVEEDFIRNDQGVVPNGWGRILAARYHQDRDTYHAYLYQDEHGDDAWYDDKGMSLVRDVLRSPLKFQRITSSFRGRRFHPVLKRYKAHNGVDYGAPKGTPVYAVASGKVRLAGRYGGAGIAVELDHNKKMLTQYFHLSKLARGVRKGVRVKQGQVIGYVGKTGLASGYHLHFGMKIDGRYVNPLSQKFQPGPPVARDRRGDFVAHMDRYATMLQAIEGAEALPLVRLTPVLEQYKKEGIEM